MIKIIDQFWQMMKRTESGCWEWQRQILKSGMGYGVVKVNGKAQQAHRVAWEKVFGPIPPGLLCLHRCDNARCANPFHLFIGTQKDNIQDCIRKGRRSRIRGPYKSGFGEQSAKTTITESEALDILKSYVPKIVTCTFLAEKYGITHQTVLNIVKGKTWKHLPRPAELERRMNNHEG